MSKNAAAALDAMAAQCRARRRDAAVKPAGVCEHCGRHETAECGVVELEGVWFVLDQPSAVRVRPRLCAVHRVCHLSAITVAREAWSAGTKWARILGAEFPPGPGPDDRPAAPNAEQVLKEMARLLAGWESGDGK